MTQVMPSTTPVRMFEDHEAGVSAVAVFSDQRRMVTCSGTTIRLWDLRKGVVLNKTEGHSNRVQALAVSRDGRLIASGDCGGVFMIWDGDTGESLQPPIGPYNSYDILNSLDFSPDGTVLASASSNRYMGKYMTNLWSTETWQQQGGSIQCGAEVHCVRYSPSGEHLAIATDNDVQIYNPGTRSCITTLKIGGESNSLAWTPDGTRLFSAATFTIREWDSPTCCDSSTWQQVGDPWKGHFKTIRAIALNSTGTLLASASDDNRVRLWRLSDRRTIAAFRHSGEVHCITFSADDRHILSGGADKKISEWPVAEPEEALPQPEDGLTLKELATHQPKAQAYSDFKVLTINSAARNACIAGDLPAAEKVLSQEIEADDSNYTSYANRALVMARNCDWDHALHDAIKSLSIKPSLAGHISKGIALCGKKQVAAASAAFDLASIFSNGDLKTSHFLFLIKTIALFNANEHKEALLRIGELAVFPNVNPLSCRIVDAYLRVQLGNIALDDARYDEAVDHFTAAVNASAFFYQSAIHSLYEEFTVLFGWDLKSLWQTTNQQLCYALFQTGRIGAAIESYQSIMDKSDGTTKAKLRAWFNALK